MTRFAPLVLLTLAACSRGEAPLGAPMDRHPGGRTELAAGALVVEEGGRLLLRGADGEARALDLGVDPRVAVAPDGSFAVYAKRAFMDETDLWLVDLPGGSTARLTDWRGSEDRPVVSPDGARLAFISGYTGVGSWWVADVPATGLLLSMEAARQLTNTDLGPIRPGFPRTGWTAPPSGAVSWTSAGIAWEARDGQHTVVP